MRTHCKLLGVLAGLALATNAHGASMSVNPVAPAEDGADIAVLVGTTDIGGNEGHAWSNRPRQGQAFVTGGDPLGYLLNAYTVRVRVDQASTTAPNWEVRVNGVNPGDGSLTPIVAENAAGVAIPNSTDANGFPAYVTFTLDTPVFLLPNAVYGVDLYPDGGGFISLNDTTLSGPPWGAYSAESPGSTAFPANPGTFHDANRHFHADLTVAPEPSTALLGLLGLVFLARRRR